MREKLQEKIIAQLIQSGANEMKKQKLKKIHTLDACWPGYYIMFTTSKIYYSNGGQRFSG